MTEFITPTPSPEDLAEQVRLLEADLRRKEQTTDRLYAQIANTREIVEGVVDDLDGSEDEITISMETLFSLATALGVEMNKEVTVTVTFEVTVRATIPFNMDEDDFSSSISVTDIESSNWATSIESWESRDY